MRLVWLFGISKTKRPHFVFCPLWVQDGSHDGISYIKGLMESTCRQVLGDEIDYRLVQIQAGTNPPPYVTLKSCVYILYVDSTDEVYCGETDDLRGRITTHRSGKSNVSGLDNTMCTWRHYRRSCIQPL